MVRASASSAAKQPNSESTPTADELSGVKCYVAEEGYWSSSSDEYEQYNWWPSSPTYRLERQESRVPTSKIVEKPSFEQEPQWTAWSARPPLCDFCEQNHFSGECFARTLQPESPAYRNFMARMFKKFHKNNRQAQE